MKQRKNYIIHYLRNKMDLKRIYLLFVISFFYNNLQAQVTVSFISTELQVNDSLFLYDLDSILREKCDQCEESNKTDSIYLISFKMIRTCIYDLKIQKNPSLKYLKYAQFFFKYNGNNYFVDGIFPDCPKELFSKKNKDQTYVFSDISSICDDCIDTDGDCCVIILEYSFRELFFREKIW